ncbi:MAG: HNH endonuclease [Kofleriaceae bacterium]|nr:HNH endonuclease [Kofleriaceae bacterium]
MATAQVAAQRTVNRRSLDNGMVKFEVVLPSDEAAIVWTALNAALDTSRAEPTRAEQTPEGPSPAEPTPAEHSSDKPPTVKLPTSANRGRQRADAFMNIIQDRLRGARPQRTPIEIIITVPHASLHGSSEPADLAMMADAEIIAATTARRLCCDAGVVVAHVAAQGVPLSVGRKTRTIPVAIKRALLLRDRTCRFPGCTHSRYVDGHHIEHWANGGKTALSKRLLLCSAHHTLLHEGGCRVEANVNGWNFFDHRNRIIDAQPACTTSSDVSARRGVAALHDAHAEFAITANTNASKWTGGPIDDARCIDDLV